MPFTPITMGNKNPIQPKINFFNRPVTFNDRVTFVGPDSSVEFLGGRIVGDLMSANWDGSFDLTTVDSTATEGFYLDSAVGSMQLEGDLWVGGDITLRDGGTISSGSAQSGIVIDGTIANYRTLAFTSGYSSGGLVATDYKISLNTPSPSTDYSAASLYLEGANVDTPTLGKAHLWADEFQLKETAEYSVGDVFCEITVDRASFSGSTFLQMPVKTTTGDPASPSNGDMYVNTSNNKIRCYADGAWRDLATW